MLLNMHFIGPYKATVGPDANPQKKITLTLLYGPMQGPIYHMG